MPEVSDADLLAAIQSAIGASVSHNLYTSGSSSDRYEAYVWSLVVRAARRAEARVTYWTRQNQRTQRLYFRKSPGDIYSDALPYTHALLQFPDAPALEVHLGVYVSGASWVSHECDVAVIRHAEAVTCRQERVDPRCSQTPLAIECKCYGDTLNLYLGRAFIGLEKEIAGASTFFVSNSDSESIAAMLTKHKHHWMHDVLPNTDVERDLLGRFHGIFRDYRVASRNRRRR